MKDCYEDHNGPRYDRQAQVGEVYADLMGTEIAEREEYNTGWLHISATERVLVRYKRYSHSTCWWTRVEK